MSAVGVGTNGSGMAKEDSTTTIVESGGHQSSTATEVSGVAPVISASSTSTIGEEPLADAGGIAASARTDADTHADADTGVHAHADADAGVDPAGAGEAGTAGADTTTDTDADELTDSALIGMERELLLPRTRASQERLRELLAPDLLIIGSVGQVWDLEHTIDALASERPAEAVEVEDPAGYAVRRLAGEVRQVTYETRRADGVRVRRNSIWTRSATGWRMAYHQGTPVP